MRGARVLTRSIILIAILIVFIGGAAGYYIHRKEAWQYEQSHWNCVTDEQLSQAKLQLAKVDKSVSQKDYKTASKILTEALAAFPYQYMPFGYDDSGLYLSAAEDEERHGKVIYVPHKRDIFAERIEASTTPTISSCRLRD